MMLPQGKYIYGIIEEPKPRKFSFCGVVEAGVYTINYQNLAAVVSDIELQEIDPTRKNVHTHTVVQDELLKEYFLLPMGFGIIARSEDEVRRLLEKNYHGLVSELKRLTGKIEVELKVFWDGEAIVKELQSKSEEFSKLKVKIKTASSPVEARSLMVEAGELVEHIALDWKAKYAEQVYEILKGLSLEAKSNSLVGVKNLLNTSFLIEKSRESEFKEKVYKLDAEYQGRVNFKYVGPLPPYNFINLKLESVK